MPRFLDRVWHVDVAGMLAAAGQRGFKGKLPAKPTLQHVLLALATYANKDGLRVFPSQACVAWQTNLSERAVRDCFRVLEAVGVLVLTQPRRYHHAARYRLTFDHVPKRPPWEAAREARRAGLRADAERRRTSKSGRSNATDRHVAPPRPAPSAALTRNKNHSE